MDIIEKIDNYLNESSYDNWNGFNTGDIKGMEEIAKSMGKNTSINPSAVMRYFKLKKLDLMTANDIMAKYSKSKKWVELSRNILNTKGVL